MHYSSLVTHMYGVVHHLQMELTVQDLYRVYMQHMDIRFQELQLLRQDVV